MVKLAMHEGAGQHPPAFLARDQISEARGKVLSGSLGVPQGDRHRRTVGYFSEQPAQCRVERRDQPAAFMGGHGQDDCIRVERLPTLAKDLIPSAAPVHRTARPARRQLDSSNALSEVNASRVQALDQLAVS